MGVGGTPVDANVLPPMPGLTGKNLEELTHTLALNIITSVLGNSININSLYHDNNDYVDIDEGALVKVEFSKTLRSVSGCKIFSLDIHDEIFSAA